MDWNFATMWEAVADRFPDRVALVHGEQRRTFAEWDDRSARLAGALAAAGVGASDKVALYQYNGPEYLESLFAALKLRAVPVNVNYRYTEDELLYLLENSDAKALVFDGALAGAVQSVQSRAAAVRAWIQVGGDTGAVAGAEPYEGVLADATPAPRVQRSPDDLVFLYTGGTTGMPKAVMWRSEDLYGVLAEGILPMQGLALPGSSREAADVAARIVAQWDAAGQTGAQLPAAPLMHGTGLYTTMFALTTGAPVVTLRSRSFDADELWQVVARERVMVIVIVGDAFCRPMVEALEAAAARGEPYDTSSVAMVVSSGVMWSEGIKSRLLAHCGALLYDALGSSEGIGLASSVSAPGAASATARFTVGARAKVLTDDGRDVVPGSGEIGVLAVAGHVPLGYYKDDAKSAATFREIDGVRYSIPGDWARVEADGSITLLGRGSNVVNTGGEKVYPEEVEEAIKARADVADCLVVGLPDERFGSIVAAVVAPVPGAALDPAELVAGGLDGLARFKQPRHVVVVDQIRRAPNGKADYAWARGVAARERA